MPLIPFFLDNLPALRRRFRQMHQPQIQVELFDEVVAAMRGDCLKKRGWVAYGCPKQTPKSPIPDLSLMHQNGVSYPHAHLLIGDFWICTQTKIFENRNHFGPSFWELFQGFIGQSSATRPLFLRPSPFRAFRQTFKPGSVIDRVV